MTRLNKTIELIKELELEEEIEFLLKEYNINYNMCPFCDESIWFSNNKLDSLKDDKIIEKILTNRCRICSTLFVFVKINEGIFQHRGIFTTSMPWCPLLCERKIKYPKTYIKFRIQQLLKKLGEIED